MDKHLESDRQKWCEALTLYCNVFDRMVIQLNLRDNACSVEFI